MKATWRGKVIAESDDTLEVGGYRYFPRDAVRMDLLEVAPKTARDLECPHGVQFYDVVEGGVRSAAGGLVVRGAAAQDEARRPLDGLLGRRRDQVVEGAPPDGAPSAIRTFSATCVIDVIVSGVVMPITTSPTLIFFSMSCLAIELRRIGADRRRRAP